MAIARQRITIEAADGRQLSARWWEGADFRERSMLFLPGLAAPQEYLQFFAGYLAQAGWGVLTFDYRSAGSSRMEGDDATVTIDDWIERDLPAAAAEVRRRANPRHLAIFAHSIGGQILGQSPIRHEVDSAVLFCAQRGIPSLYRGWNRMRVELAYLLFPAMIISLGRLPVSRHTFPAPCSGRAIRQWVRWGRHGRFTDWSGRSREEFFGDYRGRLTAVTVTDDEDYAPPQAVEALTRLYANAELRRERLDPAAWGLESMGHFGFFRRQTPREIWGLAEHWLRG